MSEAFSLASGAKTAVAEHYMTTGSFPDDNEAAGLATTITGNYVDSVEVSPSGSNGVITVAFSSDAHSKLHDGEMTLTAVDTGGSIGFSCIGTTGRTDITAYLPSICDTGDLVHAGPTAWNSLSDEEKLSTTACWEGEPDITGSWVAGPNAAGDALSQTKLRNQATNDLKWNSLGNLVATVGLDADVWWCSD